MTTRSTRLSLAQLAIIYILLTNVIAQKCTKRCPKHTSLVCGSDGTTYKNQCKLENRACSRRGLYRVSDGDCNVQGCKRQCGTNYEPVCATDGVTYDNLCRLDNAACDDAGISMRSNGACPKEVILTSFESDLDATGVTRGPSEVTFQISVQSASGSQSVRGRGLWKLGIYGCRYDDGWCDKINHIPQILSDTQASTALGRGTTMTISDIKVMFDVSIIGCEDLPYICTEFSKGDDPRPDYVLTMPGQFGSAISCFQLECFRLPVTESPQWTPACRYECPGSGNTVCGSDGVTYNTECALDNERRCSEDPNSYLLQRKHYGPCRTGVIIDSMFWSAQGIEASPGRTMISVQALVMSNSTGESISGMNLWRMGLYGSRFQDGSGRRLGYVPQLLDSLQASTPFAAGKAIVLNAEADFDVSAVGCSHYKFICLEFTKGDSPQPQFPFKGNSGPEDGSIFIACQQVPCSGQPEPEIPDDGRKRVYVGELGWGLRAGRLRPDGLYDVTLNVNAQILGTSDYVSGNNLLRVGIFGSKNIYGEGRRFGFQRQTLSRSQSSSELRPNSNLVFENITTQFPVTGVGCSEYGFLCAELAKSDSAQQDFLLIPESLDISSTPDSVIICKEIPCRNPEGPRPGSSHVNEGTTEIKTGRLRFLNWRLSVDYFRSPEPSDLVIEVNGNPDSRSDSITGDGLWRVGLYASEDSDPMGTKHRYNPQILSYADQSVPMGRDTPLVLSGITTKFNVEGLGCGQLNYICLEFTRGYFPKPDFILPLPQEDNDGITKRIASCKPWPCQDRGGSDVAPDHGGSDAPPDNDDVTPAEKSPFVAFSNLRWERRPAPGSSSDVNLIIRLTPHPLSNRLSGNNLWKVGLFGSDTSDGTGTRYEEIENILSNSDQDNPVVLGEILEFDIISPNAMRDIGCRHSYLCIQFSKNRYSIPSFDLTLGNKDFIVSCQRLPCDDSRGHGGGTTGGHGSDGTGNSGGTGGSDRGTGRHDGGNPPTGDSVALSSLRWSAPRTSVDNPSDITFRIMLTSQPHSSPLEGYNLWKISLFGSDNADGSGVRFRERDNVLTGSNRNMPVIPGQNLEFDITTRYDVGSLGCSKSYLCIDFGKNSYSSQPFNLDLGNKETLTSCKRISCDDSGNLGVGTGDPDRGGDPSAMTGETVAFSNLHWSRLPSQPTRPDDINLLIRLTPHPLNNPLSGYNLWKVGLFASDNSDGTGQRFRENENVLSTSDRNNPILPGEYLEFNIATPYDLEDIGCGHPYLCIQFGKNRYSSLSFNIELGNKDSIISCQRVSCNPPSRGHGTESGLIDPSLNTAIFHNISWSATAAEPRSGVITDLNIQATLFPKPNTDTITGKRLWRLGLYGNMYKDGSAPQRLNYAEQILTPKQAKKPLYPNSPLVFDVDTRFPLYGFGCDLHRYLCIEFAQHSQPIPQFNFPVENGAHVSCRPYFCQDQPNSEPNAGQPVASIDNFSWRLEPPRINFDGLTDLRVFVNVTPNANTDVISGQHLWRIGVYGSRNQRGGEPYEMRFDYDPQILQVHDARRILGPNQPLKFDVNIKFNMKMLGCGQYRYFCVEFGKDRLAVPQFSMTFSSGDVTVNCQRVLCQSDGDTPEGQTGGPDHGTQPDGAMKTARLSNAHWRLLGPTIYSNGDSDLRVLMELTPHPISDRIDGVEGSELWRVGIFANRNEEGTHPLKVNYERQILSQEDRDQSLIPPNTLNFDISTTFDLRRAHCSSEYPFLCLEIAKGETAWPDFHLPFPNGALAFVTCQRSPCLETDTRVHSNVPVVTVTSVNIGGVTIRPDITNRLFMDVRVNLAAESSTIRGANLWRLEMWGSTNPNGRGPRINSNDQALSETQSDRSYVPPEPLMFAAVPFDLDMRGQRCGDVTHVCAAISKLDNAVPQFALEATPNNDVLTTCRPVDCSNPLPSQITVTGLSLFQTVHTTLYANQQNSLILGIRVNYNTAHSVSFTGTDLWRLAMWMSPKANGKGKKLRAVNQILNASEASRPFVVGHDLQFEGIEYNVNLMGKRCKDARYVCATLTKNAQSSEPYELIASNKKVLTKCLAVNCA